MPTIINASNRLPITLGETLQRSPGGLVAALEGFDVSGASQKWIGWPGGTVAEPAAQAALKAQLESEFGCFPIFLSEQEVSDYYHGFSNSSLWPILHYMPNYVRHEAAWWDAYRAVNHRFANVIADTAADDDVVWIHDYHLMLLPAILRAKRPNLRIGFFLHTPFPSYEIFRCHPQRSELLEGLLGADLIGFHTFGYSRHFRSAVLRVLGLEPEMDYIAHGGRHTHIGVYPIGINATKFEEELASDRLRKQIAEYREVYKDKKLVLSVERLDYTKGIVHRLEAIDRFLENYPEKNRICFIMISVPSRGEVPEYQNLLDQVEHLVGRINGRHATVDNVPVHFIFQSVDFTELCALYCMADVAMVTPLIDGMNLVAKEYVACQRDGEGVLILSEFAGAAEELFDAIVVNPYDIQGVAEKLRHALELSSTTRSGRMRHMRERVLRNDAKYWARTFLRDLVAKEHHDETPVEVDAAAEDLVAEVRNAKGAKALCLDYDGTLREFVADPDAAMPTPQIRDILTEFQRIPAVDVYLVSGRRRDDLESWLADYSFTLIAEHGYAYRPSGSTEWLDVVPNVDLTWKEQVLRVFRHYEDSTPGSWVEQKQASMVWHYRRSDPEFGRWKAKQLVGELYEVISNLPVELHHGKAIVEVCSMHISKGAALERLCSEKPYDLVLCAGDDQTDETMFAARLPNLVSIKVGPGDTVAKYRIASPQLLRQVLQRLVESIAS
jgi:trehalose 6-phosphate synthase/phosphatase